jgi:hypothetical protein
MDEQQKLSKFSNCYSQCYYKNRDHPNGRKRCTKRCSKRIYKDKNVNNLPCEAKCKTLRYAYKQPPGWCKKKCKENFETKTNNNNYLLIFIIIILFFIIMKYYNKK